MSEEVVYHDAPKAEDHRESVAAVKVEPEEVEKTDRGMFDFLGKKKEEETAISSEFEKKAHVSEPESKPEEKKESLLQKLHRSDSSSSSSSDEECKDGEKKKKKKPLKEQIKEKLGEHKEKTEEEKIKKHEDDTCVPIEKYEEVAAPPPPPPTEVIHTSEPTCEPEEKKRNFRKDQREAPRWPQEGRGGTCCSPS